MDYGREQLSTSRQSISELHPKQSLEPAIPHLFDIEDRVLFKEALPDICDRFGYGDRLYARKPNYQTNWESLYFTDELINRWGLKTFDENTATLYNAELNVVHEMISEGKSFIEYLKELYDGKLIVGHLRTDEQMKLWEDEERFRHYKAFDIWGDAKWTKMHPEKSHLNQEGEYLSTEENLERVERRMFGESLDLLDLCQLTMESMDEITPDLRGLQVLYSI